MLGVETRASCLYSENFTHWVISQRLCCILDHTRGWGGAVSASVILFFPQCCFTLAVTIIHCGSCVMTCPSPNDFHWGTSTNLWLSRFSWLPFWSRCVFGRQWYFQGCRALIYEWTKNSLHKECTPTKVLRLSIWPQFNVLRKHDFQVVSSPVHRAMLQSLPRSLTC